MVSSLTTNVLSIIRSAELQEDFTCKTGITPTQVKTLIAYTQNERDTAVHNGTADWQGGLGRFASSQNFVQWHRQERYLYTLVDKDHQLVGIIWFGSKEITRNSHYGFTFAIRLYGRARGAGLSQAFTQEALKHFRTTKIFLNKQNQGIWLETAKNNLRAIHVYQKLGCTQIGESKNGRVLMVFPD